MIEWYISSGKQPGTQEERFTSLRDSCYPLALALILGSSTVVSFAGVCG